MVDHEYCLGQLSVACSMPAGLQPDASAQQRSLQLALAAELEDRKLSKARQVGQAGKQLLSNGCWLGYIGMYPQARLS